MGRAAFRSADGDRVGGHQLDLALAPSAKKEEVAFLMPIFFQCMRCPSAGERMAVGVYCTAMDWLMVGRRKRKR